MGKAPSPHRTPFSGAALSAFGKGGGSQAQADWARHWRLAPAQQRDDGREPGDGADRPRGSRARPLRLSVLPGPAPCPRGLAPARCSGHDRARQSPQGDVNASRTSFMVLLTRSPLALRGHPEITRGSQSRPRPRSLPRKLAFVLFPHRSGIAMVFGNKWPRSVHSVLFSAAPFPSTKYSQILENAASPCVMLAAFSNGR